MKIKTAELTGMALDWVVAQCEGYVAFIEAGWIQTLFTNNGWKPSTDWAQGGPIIEREQIDLYCNREKQWLAAPQRGIEYMGATPLIAAMRCYVASKLGDTVDVPEELL